LTKGGCPKAKGFWKADIGCVIVIPVRVSKKVNAQPLKFLKSANVGDVKKGGGAVRRRTADPRRRLL
jgi:hypothetical protein